MRFERPPNRQEPNVLWTRDPKNFTVTFKVIADGENSDEWNCILFGIILKKRRTESFCISFGKPLFGWFISDFGCLWAEDGTYDKVMSDCCPEEHIWMQFRCDPLPQLFARRSGEAMRVLNFKTPIPAGEYMPCVILIAENSVVEMTVEEVGGPQDGTLLQMWEQRKFTDVEVWLVGKEGRTGGAPPAQTQTRTNQRNRPRKRFPGFGFRRNLVEFAQFFAPDLFLHLPQPENLPKSPKHRKNPNPS